MEGWKGGWKDGTGGWGRKEGKKESRKGVVIFVGLESVSVCRELTDKLTKLAVGCWGCWPLTRRRVEVQWRAGATTTSGRKRWANMEKTLTPYFQTGVCREEGTYPRGNPLAVLASLSQAPTSVVPEHTCPTHSIPFHPTSARSPSSPTDQRRITAIFGTYPPS